MDLLPFGAFANALLQLVKDPKLFLECIAILWVMVWWYRDIKVSLNDQKNLFVSRLDKILEIYGALEIGMLRQLRSPDPDTEKVLFDVIGKSFPYMSDRLFEHISLYMRYRSVQQLRTCLGIIQEETPKLLERYLGKLPNVHDSLENSLFYPRVIFKSFIPAVMTFVSMATAAFFVSIVYSALSQKVPNDTLSGLLNFSSILWILMGGYLFIFDKDYRSLSKKAGVLLPTLLLATFLFHNWIYKFAIVAGAFLFCTYLMKKNIEKRRRDLPSGNYI